MMTFTQFGQNRSIGCLFALYGSSVAGMNFDLLPGSNVNCYIIHRQGVPFQVDAS